MLGSYYLTLDGLASLLLLDSCNWSQEIDMAMRNFAAGKMAMRDNGADKEVIISTTLQQFGVKEEYEKLRSAVNDAKFSVMVLESRLLGLDGHEDEAAMREKLEKARELVYEAEDKLDELSFEIMRTFHHIEEEITREASSRKVRMISSLSLVRGYPLLLYRRKLMSSKIKDLQHVLNNLKGEIGHGATATRQKEKDIDKAMLKHYIGADVIENDWVVNYIKSMQFERDVDERLVIIPIVGMAGVGKTAQARRFYLKYESWYELAIWVTVSQKGLNVRKVAAEIVKACNHTTGSISSSLEENLSGKRFLLVLDDVLDQDKEKWNNLVRMLTIGLNGSTMVVTTPSAEVASMVCTRLDPSYNLSELSADASWKLFEREAFESAERSEDHPVRKTLESSTIVKQCHGLPLVLKAVGRAFRFKPNVEWWAAALQTLADKSAATVFQIPILKICYDSIPSVLQKRCFAYCSVFPENFTIEKKSLIQQWMAHGFLEEEEVARAAASSSTSSSGAGDHHVKRLLMEDIGDSYLESLVNRSLLLIDNFDPKEDEPLEYRMHGLFRDFARTLLGNDSILSNRAYLHSPSAVNIPLDAPFLKFKSLRVLELTHFSKDELPSSIGDLMHLRYLDLSYGTFKALPASISKLYHLQTLKLLHCINLQRLPRGMTKLINLRHLENERSLRNIPRGFIRKQSDLQTFNFFHVGNTTVTDEAGIEELQFLKHLRGRLCLIGLDNVKNEKDATAANLKEKTRLEELMLEWESDWHVCTNDQDREKQDFIFEELQPPQKLLVLTILRFRGTKLPTWLDDGSSHLMNLQELCIHACHHVKSLDLKGLKSLQKLIISYCENLEYARIVGLLQLELLEFNRCDKLKSLLGLGFLNQEEQLNSSREELVHNIPDLNRLEKLHIKSCDHLTNLREEEMSLLESLNTLHIENCKNSMVFPKGTKKLKCLKHLQIENCPNLKELPEGIPYLVHLRHFSIKNCPKLMVLSKEILRCTHLRRLSISNCTNLRHLPEGIEGFENLEELEINGCDFLVSLPREMQKMWKLQKLKIERCSHLMDLPESMCDIHWLRYLEISSCYSLTCFPKRMQDLTLMDTLKITGCDNLTKLPEQLGNPSKLRVLAICGCSNLQVLPKRLGEHQYLHLLEITNCSNLEALPESLGELSLLQSLNIQKCFNLRSFPNRLQQMTSLRVLWLIECHKLQDFPDGLRSLLALEKLAIWGCHNLIQPLSQQGIENLKSLQELTISNCSKLESLPEGLENLPSLKELVIWSCPKLKYSESKIQQLIWRKLRKLRIRDCPYLETVDDESDPDYIVITPPTEIEKPLMSCSV